MFSLIIILLILTYVWYQVTYGHRNALLAKFPSPKRLPIFHNALILRSKSAKEVFDWLEEMKNKLGPVYLYTLDPFDNGSFIVSDPEIAEVVLKSTKLLDKGHDYNYLKPWLNDGLSLSKGQKWHQRRKILSPAFHFKILEKFAEIMNDHGTVLIDKLHEFNGKVVDVFPLVSLCTLDVICGE